MYQNQLKHPEMPVGVFRAEFLDDKGNWDGYSYALRKDVLLKDVRDRTLVLGDKLVSEPRPILVPVKIARDIENQKARTLRTNCDFGYKKSVVAVTAAN